MSGATFVCLLFDAVFGIPAFYCEPQADVFYEKGSKKGANPFTHLLPLILTAGVWNTLNKISVERNSRHRVNSPPLYSLFLAVVFQTFAVKETRASSSICLCITIVYMSILFLFNKANIHNYSDSAK